MQDIDGNSYNTVIIEKEIWTRENLFVTHFRNGDAINEATNPTMWIDYIQKKEPAFMRYYDKNKNEWFGLYYNYYAVIDKRILPPEGWKLPNSFDWNFLVKELGGKRIAGRKLKSKFGWRRNFLLNGNGTNESGFSALPGGSVANNGTFGEFGENAMWWSVSYYADSIGLSEGIILSYRDNNAFIGGSNEPNPFGLNVRCIKDKFKFTDLYK